MTGTKMTNEATILCVALVATCLGAHASRHRTTLASMTWQQLLRKTWKDVTRQIDITLRHHRRQDYDALYEQVRTPSFGGHGHIPTWIPGKGDVIGLTHREVGDHLLKLYNDLQKFEIIMGEVGRGEGDSVTLKHMMVSTRAFLQQLQQEVKKALMGLEIGVPSPPVKHAVMIAQERKGLAAGMARDKGILRRYRHYLQQWVRRWCAGTRRRRRIQRKLREPMETRNCEQGLVL